jgi:hypothetical protein
MASGAPSNPPVRQDRKPMSPRGYQDAEVSSRIISPSEPFSMIFVAHRTVVPRPESSVGPHDDPKPSCVSLCFANNSDRQANDVTSSHDSIVHEGHSELRMG